MSAEPRAQGLSIFGFPVRASPFYFLVVAMLGVRDGRTFDERALLELSLWLVVVTISILWHELGHAFAMRRYGFSPSIELHGMGGQTLWGEGPRPTPGQRVIVSLAGPFAGLLLGGLVWAGSELLGPLPHWSAERALELLVWCNVVWGLVNLVPMLPWDGGQALHGILDGATRGRGAKPIGVITLVLGALALAFAALVLKSLWLSFLVIVSLAAGWRALRASSAKPEQRTEESALSRVRSALTRVGAERVASHVLREQRSDDWALAADELEGELRPDHDSAVRAEVLELTAWARLLAGDVDGAERACAAMPASHEPSAALGALVAIRRGRHAAALTTARELADDEGGTRLCIEAHALVSLGRLDDAVALGRGTPERANAAYVDELLFREGHYDHAAALGELAFERFGDANDAYNAACSHARAGRAGDALGWLERAIDAGYRDVEHLEKDDDLEPVRRLEGFATLRARLRS